MIVTIDKNAGFCWGVVRAIDFAEKELENVGTVFCLGDIIHNAVEVKRLEELGLKTITIDDFSELPKGSKVLVRAHGEPPETYKKAFQNGIEIVDATCPIVTKVQERVKKFVDQGYQIVIFGKQNHAEVIGVNGVTGYTAIVIKSVKEALEKVSFDKPTVLFSQTTMDKETFAEITEALQKKLDTLVVDTIEDTAIDFHSKNTICGQVSGREKKLQHFARSNDVIIFTAGRKSSNGKVLYNIAKKENEKTYFAETKDEIDYSWFIGANTVGITGATSTPHWVMQEIKEMIENHFELVH